MLANQDRLSVEDVFTLYAEQFGSYEYRAQQLELATSINRVFSRKETGVFEAGTGTGKSLAALIPAVLSGKRVVISSATIALQEQYIYKDIPSLQAILPGKFTASLIKGRGNYISLRRYEDHLLEQAVDDRLIDWVASTENGDLSELDFIPSRDLWQEINSDTDDCLRNKCPSFMKCFYFETKRQAEKADILVVNHSLLLADAASDGNILPPYDLLIVDEAHHLPDIARDAFSSSISNRGLRFLTARARKKLNVPAQIVHDIENEGEEFFYRLAYRFTAQKTRIRDKIEDAEGFRSSLLVLRDWLEKAEFENIIDVDMSKEKAKLKARALLTTVNKYVSCLELLEVPSEDWVIWAERADVLGSKFSVVAAPLDVTPYLQSMIFDKSGLEASVWMSATLSTSGEDPFLYFKNQLGIVEHVIQNQVASPFDYKRQALLYLPNDLPEPNHPEYMLSASQEIEKIVRASNGRAFVLFTSYQAMNANYEMLKPRLPFECKCQGEMPRKKLIEWFRETYNSVLFGTSSFWEGVSIDGDQLSCVIIDRIPFQVPDDPIYEAQCDVIKNHGTGKWFQELALPYAIMRLKQGVGRLIRTRSDRGIVAILDPRLSTKSYGKSIIKCLPPMKVIKQLDGSIDQLLDDLQAS